MKLITLITLALIFIGCGSGNPETPEAPPAAPPETDQKLKTGGGKIEDGPLLPPNPSLELEAGVSSQTVLTCSKEGAEDIVYIAKTYEAPRGCQHSRAEGKMCLCEVLSTHGNFENQNGIYLFATETSGWCEGNAIDSIESNRGVTVYGSTGTQTEFVSAAHDESYTCSRS